VAGVECKYIPDLRPLILGDMSSVPYKILQRKVTGRSADSRTCPIQEVGGCGRSCNTTSDNEGDRKIEADLKPLCVTCRAYNIGRQKTSDDKSDEKIYTSQNLPDPEA
jgi:hypothetical protein